MQNGLIQLGAKEPKLALNRGFGSTALFCLRKQKISQVEDVLADSVFWSSNVSEKPHNVCEFHRGFAACSLRAKGPTLLGERHGLGCDFYLHNRPFKYMVGKFRCMFDLHQRCNKFKLTPTYLSLATSGSTSTKWATRRSARSGAAGGLLKFPGHRIPDRSLAPSLKTVSNRG